MKILLLFPLLLLSAFDPAPKKAEPMSAPEKELLQSINQYRKSKGLREIKASAGLNLVAQLHARELQAEEPKEPCNMHSWSGKFGEKACCYTDDHREAACMWSKPGEFSSYKGNGYEIAAYNSGEEVNWLEQWKGSPGHHEVIINQNTWRQTQWNAIGIAIRQPYAVVWFGKEADTEKGN